MTPAEIVAETANLYSRGGRPAPRGHQQFAVQMLMKAEKPERLLKYVQWAFASRLWREPAKTKSLLQLLKDGDWDCDIDPPKSARREATPEQQARDRAEYEESLRRAHPDDLSDADRAWLAQNGRQG